MTPGPARHRALRGTLGPVRGPKHIRLVIVVAVLAAVAAAFLVPVTNAVAGTDRAGESTSLDAARVARAGIAGRLRPSAPVPVGSESPASLVTGPSRFTPDEPEQCSPRRALRLRFSRRGPPLVAA